jgi:glycosyltransferase involved in cell wall biosynthesis
VTPDLVVELESPLPTTLPVGQGTAVFCAGACFHPHETVENLEIVVDGVHRHRPAAFAMPRPDVFAARGQARSYRSGFWAVVPIEPPTAAGAVELSIAAVLEGGSEAAASLGRIEVVEPEAPASHHGLPTPAGPGLIAVCMATFEPDATLFAAQIESLRAQTDDRWICVISDDASGEEHFAGIAEVVGADPRFLVSRSPARLGFYDNFERALRLAPAEADLLALCDQDDVWHPDKLEVLRGALGSAQLVYSDQRLTDADGRVLRQTMWQGRSNNHTNLASMLVANTITGAATLFRREVAELALPFPEPPGFRFHDHWLGLVALASGEVAYVDRPLYDYVQHAGAIFGDVSQGGRGAEPARGRGWRQRLLEWRAAYFYGYLARETLARTLLVRSSTTLTAGKRRALERFGAAARSPAAFAWLAARPLRGLVGRNETLASEAQIARGILWRWLIGLRARRSEPPGRGIDDAGLPPPASFSQTRLRRWRARL